MPSSSPRHPEVQAESSQGPATAVAAIAASLPALLAYNLPPSSTFFNQAAAMLGWGGFAGVVAILAMKETAGAGHGRARSSGLTALFAAFAILIAAAAASTLFGSLPSSLSLSAIGMVLAAIVLAWAGAKARSSGLALPLFRAFCIAWVVAGVLSSAVGIVQVFLPHWAEVLLISPVDGASRATGNLRQPNHLASLLIWSLIATVWLFETKRLRKEAAVALLALFVFSITLTASRTGVVELIAVALWGALDRRLSRTARILLVLMPLFYVASWFGLNEWAQEGQRNFFGGQRLQQADVSSSRFAIWSNALDLIRAHPWLGVGFGEFNFAWTLTPFPGRPTEFFDHPHNLVLHFGAELGAPLGLLVTGLLCWSFWRSYAASRDEAGRDAGSLRAAFVMLLTIAIHSQLEYPLWYAYFLLPTAWLFGLCLGTQHSGTKATTLSPRTASHKSAAALLLASLLVIAGTVASLLDYNRVVVIFAPQPGASPLADRIAEGRRSWFFAHHADYAAATTSTGTEALAAFKGASHYLLDSRLMLAWAQALAESGDMQRASYVAQRLREFRNADGVELFAPCSSAQPPQPLPYQCAAPTQALGFEDFR